MDLDALRDGLRAAPDQPLPTVDIAEVMAQGRRIRWRRRLLVGSAGTAVVVATAVATTWAATGNAGHPTGLSVGGAPGTAATGSPAPGAPTSAPARVTGPVMTSEPPDPNVMLGLPIRTGIRTSAGELIIHGVPVDLAQLPDIHFGLMAGAGDPFQPLVETNEVTGSDRSAGFHAVQATTGSGGVTVPEFGYYAGPAVKITATVGHRRIVAHQATWSVDSTIKVFWFDPADLVPGTDPTGLTAYDKAGHKLPAGNSGAGHG